MRYAIELTARNAHIRVVIDATPWPRKTAAGQAKEALHSLGQAIAAAIEGAPHIGTPRELVDISPVDHDAGSAGPWNIGPAEAEQPGPEPEKPTAPQVGPRNWESATAAIRAVKLPPGVQLVEDEDRDERALRVRHTPAGRVALFWLAEEPVPDEGRPPMLATIEVNLDLEADEIKERMIVAAEQILERVKQREEPASTGVPDGSPPTEGGDEGGGDETT